MGTSPEQHGTGVGPRTARRRDLLGAAALGSLGIATHVLPAAAQSASLVELTGNTYEVGDEGPGGGLIFFTPTSPGGDGVHYYEAAPTDYDDTDPNWIRIGGSGWGAAVATSTDVGAGPANTAEMVRLGDDPGPWAADMADLYTFEGTDDWFLPSRDELIAMWNALGNALGLVSNASYWSSSQESADRAYSLNSSNPRTIGTQSKPGGARVRPVRRFTA